MINVAKKKKEHVHLVQLRKHATIPERYDSAVGLTTLRFDIIYAVVRSSHSELSQKP